MPLYSQKRRLQTRDSSLPHLSGGPQLCWTQDSCLQTSQPMFPPFCDPPWDVTWDLVGPQAHRSQPQDIPIILPDQPPQILLENYSLFSKMWRRLEADDKWLWLCQGNGTLACRVPRQVYCTVIPRDPCSSPGVIEGESCHFKDGSREV